MLRTLFALVCLIASLVGPVRAQETVTGTAINRSTVNGSVSITTGLTYQQVLASNLGTATQRQALTIENNNTNGDNCFVIVGTGQVTAGTTTTSTNLTIGGVTMAASKFSILLGQGGSYVRYWPDVPSDAIFATCATTADSLYVDTN